MRVTDDRQSWRAETRAVGTLQLLGLLLAAILTVLTVGSIGVAGPARAVAAASSPWIARLGTVPHQMGETAPTCVASREHTATTAVTAYGQSACSTPGHLVSYDYDGAHGLFASVLRGGSHGYDPSARTVIASRSPSATSVAAEDASGTAADVGHAGIHQFPGVTAAKSQFFDGADLGALSDTNGVQGVVQGNGNIRFVLHASEDIGVDRTTGLPTNVYTVIRKPDGSVLTMFPGTSPKS
jgi:hypothetical protein